MKKDQQHREWWRGAVMYQIYPRSFMDSNGDGIGDMAGITARLPYIASLGVDGIWISPFFKSPQKDFGYDVSDYHDVDPIFGTLEDFDNLLVRAHELGLKVIIDQVWSHTSDQHAWFTESRQSQDNPKADWYVWHEAKEDGLPPNNWLSVFGGPAWDWDARRRQYYLHNFLPEQPDLNLHNREVQDALLDVARFWLERGVDGFRMDAINLGMHDENLTDNPPMPRLNGEVPGKPYFMQNPTYNLSHDDMPLFLERLRETTDDYGEKFTVAEIGGLDPLEIQLAYTSDFKRLSTAYAWDMLIPVRPEPGYLRQTFQTWPNDMSKGWPSWAFSNHDAPRIASRWTEAGFDADWAKLFGLLLMSLRGNIFIYQGEELGLPQSDVPFEKLQDPEGITNWPETLGRDGCRTPMPWAHDLPNAGFSTAAGPWLPADPVQAAMAVDLQQNDPESNLNYFRELIRIRKDSPALKYGDFNLLDAAEDLLAFTRSTPGETVYAVFNLSNETVKWQSADAAMLFIMASAGFDSKIDQVPNSLPAFSGYVARTFR